MDNYGVVGAYWDEKSEMMTILKWNNRGKREAKTKVDFTLQLREKQVHMTKVSQS